MPDSGTRVLSFSGSRLTASAVQRLEQTMRGERDNCPLVLDCAGLDEVTPAGLAALLELGRNATGLREIALAQLSRPLTRAAIEAGLSERFSIYATVAACTRSSSGQEPSPCAP
jgi:anti-anti-sigma regulatory factor